MAPTTRFDDLLLDAITALQATRQRGTGWDAVSPEEKGRIVEYARGVAGERRYAKATGNEAILVALDALEASAAAQLRMLEGRTVPGDEGLAGRLDADVQAYETAAKPA